MLYYYFVIVLQAYCIYDCYTKRNDYYWYFIIFFIPLFGGIVYLFTQVYQKTDVHKVQENVMTVVNPTKKITDLEKKFHFAETFENQTALADAFLESQHYDKAIEHYREALNKGFQNDFYTITKLVEAYYKTSQFNEAIAWAEKIKNDTKFRKSKALFFYGLSLEKIGEIAIAETLLQKFDAPFSNYQERLVLAQFYRRHTKIDAAKGVLNDMLLEAEQMTKQTRNTTRAILKNVKEELIALQ
ncbi:hypothetical protein MWU65_14595 [Cellulophaga sp. F20128]|uniref:hypothetical protein n=1 Tax=Cellulophaga sp. F20128 TaxID=2926413 RepID=UPI001FF3884A|nr:hypothetical protein [Cellulophaga sp. F20128]MCK0158421.1 hypothetical protein [Cellulophaga sp. F20128]